jgi:hypothetical protein
MDNDISALDALIDEAVNEEKALAVKAEELSLQSKQFADYLAAKKHNDEKLETLWMLVKQEMLDRGMTEHENDYIKLKLTPSGKYKAEDIDSVDDTLCDVVKKLNNKKVKAYVELNGKLPEGVESTGYILRKTIKEEE